METATSVSSNPRTVEEVFTDFRARRAAIVRALTSEVDHFYSLCDPEKDNLCLYGYPNDSWEVNLPAEEVPPELPEPALGINFARDGMQRKDWLSLVAVHSDSWLLAVAFYHGARLNHNDRKRLFSMINDPPTVFEVVSERRQTKDKVPADNSGSKSKVSSKRINDGQLKSTKPVLLKEDDEEDEDEDEEHGDTICGICEGIYSADEFWIGCDICQRWYHGKCVKITFAKAQSIKSYKCPLCSSKKVRQ